MKGTRLPEQDRRDADDTFFGIQARAPEIPRLWVRTGVSGAILLASTSSELCLIYTALHEYIGPLPGEPESIVPAVLSLSGLICVTAFYLYKRARPAALPVRILDMSAGYLALGFVCAMGLSLVRMISASAGGMEAALPGELFGADPLNAAAGGGLLDRVADATMAGAFGLLTVCNLYVAEAAASRLRACLRDLRELRARLSESRMLMNEINECERGLAKLDAERQAVLRELEPAGAYAFANELAGVVSATREPVEAYLTGWHLRKKPPESIVPAEGEPDIDIARLKERVTALRLDAKSIYAAFRGEGEGKKS